MVQYRSNVSYHRLARCVLFLARLVSRETRRVSFLASALEVPICERIDHQTLTCFLFTLGNMRNHALILKPRLTFYPNLWTSDTTLWCEHSTPCFDHEISTRTNILFKLVNIQHHALIMKSRLGLTFYSNLWTSDTTLWSWNLDLD